MTKIRIKSKICFGDGVTCMSLEEMEWSISIAELEEVQECGDVIYLIVMVL